MGSLILKKDGFYLREWNSEKRDYDPDELLDDGRWLLEWTEHLAEIEPGVTLGHLFGILAKLSEGERALFSSLAEAANIGLYIEEAAKPAKRRSDIDYIQIYRHAEIDWYKREGLPNFECDVMASGRCENDPVRYALDGLPVNEILHCELRLEPTMRFWDNRNDYDEKGKYKVVAHVPPFDKQPDDPDFDPNVYPTVNGKVCTCTVCCGEQFETSYKLGEVMWAVFDDICFHGSPEGRDAFFGDLLQRVDECQEALRTGKVEILPEDKK